MCKNIGKLKSLQVDNIWKVATLIKEIEAGRQKKKSTTTTKKVKYKSRQNNSKQQAVDDLEINPNHLRVICLKVRKMQFLKQIHKMLK